MDELAGDAAAALDEDEMAAFAARLEDLPPEHFDWVFSLFMECRRARAAEAQQASDHTLAGVGDNELTQAVLDTAEWLRTLWEVGYMGSSSFPTQPRTGFPTINSEDIARSALLARIRLGKHPLPFPPPTRHGVPWHEVVESEDIMAVQAEVCREGDVAWVNIEGCAEWQLLQEEEPGRVFRVQHRYKGPVYRLSLDEAGSGRLQRCPPETRRRIIRQARGGINAFLLEWPKEGGKTVNVPLPAASSGRAEDEARRWVAIHHPALYGQIAFEHIEA